MIMLSFLTLILDLSFHHIKCEVVLVQIYAFINLFRRVVDRVYQVYFHNSGYHTSFSSVCFFSHDTYPTWYAVHE